MLVPLLLFACFICLFLSFVHWPAGQPRTGESPSALGSVSEIGVFSGRVGLFTYARSFYLRLVFAAYGGPLAYG